MSDKEFYQWMLKIEESDLDATRTFAVQTCFASMRYLKKKKFSYDDFQKVLDDFSNKS